MSMQQNNRDGSTRRHIGERVTDLIERHGEDFAVEGKAVLRRIKRTVTLLGILIGLLLVTLIALAIYGIIR